MVVFNEEFKDVVEPKRKMTSFGIGPINNMKELNFYAGGHKFSQLCGFKFESKVNEWDKFFQISFVCKLRSKIWREQNTNTSRWYGFAHTSPVQVKVLSKKTLLDDFGFDVDKFFDSDLFKKFVSKFQDAVKTGVEKIIPEFIESKCKGKPAEEQEAQKYQRAIHDSIPYIGKTFFENKDYQLNDLDFRFK